MKRTRHPSHLAVILNLVQDLNATVFTPRNQIPKQPNEPMNKKRSTKIE